MAFPTNPPLRSTLPPVYAPLLPAHFDAPSVSEPRATCNDCAMCDKGNAPAELKPLLFARDLKCCTWTPNLANYLVGAILADDDPVLAEGRKRIRERIAKRVAVTPFRVSPTKKYDMLYRAAKSDGFGRAPSLRCPYLHDEQGCTIWKHREGVCTTWFCMHEDGKAGTSYWSALRAYLGFVEGTLASFAAREVSSAVKEPPAGAPDHLTIAELEERPLDDDAYRAIWADWVGREEDFYIACHAAIARLQRGRFEEIVGGTQEGRDLYAALVKAHEALVGPHPLPPRLALNPEVRTLPIANGMVLRAPGTKYDWWEVDANLYEGLRMFTHQAQVPDVRAKIRAQLGVDLDDAKLAHFVSHGVLVSHVGTSVCAMPPGNGDAWTRTVRGRVAGQAMPPRTTVAYRFALEATAANFIFAQYVRLFAGKARPERDPHLLSELAEELSEIDGRMTALISEERHADFEKDRALVRQHLALYRAELEAIPRSVRELNHEEQGSLLGRLANQQFGMYRVHFGGESRLSRRPALLLRLIGALNAIKERMQEFPRAAWITKNIRTVEGQVRMYEMELSEIRAVRQGKPIPFLIAELGRAAAKLDEEYRQAVAGRQPAHVDLGLLSAHCDKLLEVRRQLVDMSRVEDNDATAAMLLGATDQLLAYEELYAAVVRAKSTT